MARIELQRYAWLLALVGTVVACTPEPTADEPTAAVPVASADRVIVYSSLSLERTAALAEAYRTATNAQVDFLVDDSESLIESLANKEHLPSADVLLLAGLGHMAQAVERDVLRPFKSDAIAAAVSDDYRDPDGYWVGLGVRAELIVYHRESVDAAAFTDYGALAGAEWRGELCLQRSISERSRMLMAALIERHGERPAEIIVRGWRANLATSVFDEQEDLLAAVDDGTCGVGVAGSDEVARFIATGAEGIATHAPAADHGGTLRNLTTIGVGRHAGNEEAAQRFVEWLVSVEGQVALNSGSFELPVLDDAPVDASVAKWRQAAAPAVGPMRAAFAYEDAVQLAERARYR